MSIQVYRKFPVYIKIFGFRIKVWNKSRLVSIGGKVSPYRK